jgi:hypothetical protein
VSRVCVCSRWALTSARVTGSWSICSCRRFQPVNARSDVHPDLLGSVEVVIADDARSVHRSVAPASPPEALARIVVRPALAWRRDRKLKGEPAAENLVLLRFDQLEWRGVRRWPRASRRTGRARREHGACGSPGRRGTFWARGGPVFDYATGRHDFRSSLRSSPACRAVPTCRLMPRLTSWYLAQLCSQRGRRVPPAVATCAGLHGSRAGRRSDHTRCHGGRLVLVGGCHLARDARSTQPVRGPARRA